MTLIGCDQNSRSQNIEILRLLTYTNSLHYTHSGSECVSLPRIKQLSTSDTLSSTQLASHVIYCYQYLNLMSLHKQDSKLIGFPLAIYMEH